MLLSHKRLLQILGVLWFIDGLLQLQPRMFTMNMIDGVMMPIVQGQPAWIAVSLTWIIHVTTLHLKLANDAIAGVQLLIGGSLLIGSLRWSTSRFVKGTLIVSLAWACVVWYAGEGMNMLLTGQASILTGAPGSVLFYALLALVIYPRSIALPRERMAATGEPVGLVSRRQLRISFAAFWFVSAALQLQPYWWQARQISQALDGAAGQGGLNTLLVDPLVGWLSHMIVNAEVPLNIMLIILFIGLGVSLLLLKNERMLPVLVLSIAISFSIWWGAQGFGMIFTGMTTDFNSGLLLIVIALACWPRPRPSMEATKPSPVYRSKQSMGSPQRTLSPSPLSHLSMNVNGKSRGKQASRSFKTASHRAAGTLTAGKPVHVQYANSKHRHSRKQVRMRMTNGFHHPGKKPHQKWIVNSKTRFREKQGIKQGKQRMRESAAAIVCRE